MNSSLGMSLTLFSYQSFPGRTTIVRDIAVIRLMTSRLSHTLKDLTLRSSMLRSLTLTCLLLAAAALTAQSVSERAAVRVTATVQATPAITLSWAPISSTTSLTIYRKLKTATSWGSVVATPASTATSWTDNSVSVGTNYEYKVVRISAGVTGTGYINTGIQVPVVDYRGKIILLVDNTLTSSLATELTQLTNDLRADGWGVIRSDVSRTASVTSIKSIIQGHYNSDPTNVKALYIVGHVPT